MLTGKSETKDKAFVRYTKTGVFIQRLHDEKPWEKNSAAQTINGYHSNAANLTTKMTLKAKHWNIYLGSNHTFLLSEKKFTMLLN